MGMFGKRRLTDDDAPVDPNERSPQLGLRYKDLAVLGQLMNAGADLSQPREVVYYLYLPCEDVARSVQAEVHGKGFEAEVREPREGFAGQWAVACKRRAVVTPDFVREADDMFQTLADRHKGEFDGWEASVK